MEEVVQLTEELIRYKSTHSRPNEIHRCADHVETYLNRHGIEFQRLAFQNIPSILVTPHPGRFPVLLMSHIDVVEGADPLFNPRRQGDHLFGRGSIDDKYAVALSLVLFKEHLQKLREQGQGQSEVPFGLLITADEEIGGGNGAKKLLPLVKTDFCIALDGGSVEKIVVKEKGIVHLKLISGGVSAHAARPWLGENAIENLIEDYILIKDQFKDSLPDHWHRSINFAKISGGSSINQVPDTAEAVFDIRYTEHDNIDDLVTRMQSAVKGRLIVEKKEPVFMGGDSPYLDELLKVAAGTRTGFEHGASDARHLWEYGIKGIVWGADGDMSQHTAEEHISIRSIERLYLLLEAFLTRAAEIRSE